MLLFELPSMYVITLRKPLKWVFLLERLEAKKAEPAFTEKKPATGKK